MKILYVLLGSIICALQYQLWIGENSIRALNMLEVELDVQGAVNKEMAERNRLLEIEVLDLKNGLEAVEERARSELGMIEDGETFYLLIEK
jgi:cell division protein FtsB